MRGRFLRNGIGALGLLVALGGAGGLVAGLLGPIEFDLDAFAHLRPQFSLALFGAYVLLLIGGWRWIGAIALTSSIVGLLLLGPIWRRPQQLPADCPHAVLTVVTANFHMENMQAREAVAALLATDADVIALQEIGGSFWRESLPLQSEYPYAVTDGGVDAYPLGVGMFSKRPLRFIEASSEGPPSLQRSLAHVPVGDREVVMATFHFERPWIEEQGRQLEDLPAYLRDLPSARILLGDFNAAPWSYAVDRIEDIGQVEIVGGLRRTWRRSYPNPLGGPNLPALIGNQIDHVFISAEMGVKSIETFDMPGSPHWGVKAAIQVPLSEGGCD